MHRIVISFIATSSFVLGCGTTFPVPTQRLADAQSAQRSAEETGAANQATAKLHLKLSEEQIAQAKTAITAGDNKRADFILVRAKADAELAIALAREQTATAETQQTIVDSNQQLKTNVQQGAK